MSRHRFASVHPRRPPRLGAAAGARRAPRHRPREVGLRRRRTSRRARTSAPRPTASWARRPASSSTSGLELCGDVLGVPEHCGQDDEVQLYGDGHRPGRRATSSATRAARSCFVDPDELDSLELTASATVGAAWVPGLRPLPPAGAVTMRANAHGRPGPGPRCGGRARSSDGLVYTGTEDGASSGSATDGSRIDRVGFTGGRPLGLELLPDGRLLVCDADRGLLALDPYDGRHRDPGRPASSGRRMGFCNNAAVAADGDIWFSDSSHRLRHRAVEGRLRPRTPAPGGCCAAPRDGAGRGGPRRDWPSPTGSRSPPTSPTWPSPRPVPAPSYATG